MSWRAARERHEVAALQVLECERDAVLAGNQTEIRNDVGVRERREQRVLVAQQIGGVGIRNLQRRAATGAVDRAPDTRATSASEPLAQLPATENVAARDSAVGGD